MGRVEVYRAERSWAVREKRGTYGSGILVPFFFGTSESGRSCSEGVDLKGGITQKNVVSSDKSVLCRPLAYRD